MISDENLAQLRALIESILEERGLYKLPSKAAQKQRRYRERIKGAVTKGNGAGNKKVTRVIGSKVTNGNGHGNAVIGNGEVICVIQSRVGPVEVRQSYVREMMEAYPAVMVAQEIDRARLWMDDNPTKRKQNVRRFLSNWISRRQEKGR